MTCVLGEISIALVLFVVVTFVSIIWGQDIGLCYGPDCLAMLFIGPINGIMVAGIYGLARVAWLLVGWGAAR